MAFFDFLTDSPDPPPVPDPNRIIRQQGRVNRLDQTTPYGSLSFEGPERNEAVLEFAPGIADLFGQQQDISGALLANALQRAGQLPTTTFNPEIPAVGGVEGELPGFDQATQAQQAVFERAKGLLEPEFQRRQRRLTQELANRGLPIGSEIYSDEMNRFERERNRALEQAAFRAVGAGNERQNQLFTQGLSALGARQGVRGQNLNELQALLAGQQVQPPSLDAFYAPAQIDVMGPHQLAQNAQMARYQGELEEQQGLLSGLASLGTAAIYASNPATATAAAFV